MIVQILIQNLNQELMFHLQGSNSFDKVIKKGLSIDKALVAKGLVKTFKETKENTST